MARNRHDGEKKDMGEIHWQDCPYVARHPDVMSGAWCLGGTRLPLSALFGNLAAGLSIPEFIEQFPGTKVEHINAVLEFLANRLDATTDR